MSNNNPLQNRIMRIVESWVKEQKQAVPQQHIVKLLLEEEIPFSTIKAAVRTLVRKGYLRKAIKASAYVQLRSL